MSGKRDLPPQVVKVPPLDNRSLDPAPKCPICGVRTWEIVSCTMDGCPLPKPSDQEREALLRGLGILKDKK